MWGQVLWEQDPAREGRPGWERPSAVWPQTKSLDFWTAAYCSVNENISAVVSVACPLPLVWKMETGEVVSIT